jgi:cytochrome c biogenesis factor
MRPNFNSSFVTTRMIVTLHPFLGKDMVSSTRLFFASGTCGYIIFLLCTSVRVRISLIISLDHTLTELGRTRASLLFALNARDQEVRSCFTNHDTRTVIVIALANERKAFSTTLPHLRFYVSIDSSARRAHFRYD